MIDVAAKLEAQADILFDNLTGWEISTLQRIGKRIRKIGKLTPAELKQINNIASVKQDMDAIIKDLAKITGLNIKRVKQIYSDALESQHLENKPLYDFRNKDFLPLADNLPLQAIVNAYSKTTSEMMINLAKTKALGVIDSNGKFNNLQNAYIDILDRAVMQAASGATDFNTAMREAIKGLGVSGIRVDYGGGITRRLDTAVRQNLLWGAKQASIEYNELIGKELGCDGIEIDWHNNPRPSHEFMQGKQYSLDGKKTVNGKTFEDAAPALKALNDYGCLHFKTPIICGVSVPRYTDKKLSELNRKNAKEYTIDGKTQNGYGWTQDMRRLETEARKQKVIRETAKASGDNELVKQCNNKLKAINKKYAQISKETGIKAQPQRMSIVKNGDMPQKPLTTTDSGGIIKETHNKPVTVITDNAINRVPKLELLGMTDKQNTYIQQQHKELLRYARDNNNCNEVAFVLKKNLSDKTVFLGGEDVIDFGQDLFGMGDELFVMHNHPRNSCFSARDIVFFIDNSNIKGLSIVKNNGAAEILFKSANYDMLQLKKDFSRIFKATVKNESEQEYAKAIEKFLNKHSKQGGMLEWKK